MARGNFSLEGISLAPMIVVHQVFQRQAVFPADLLQERLGAKLRRLANAEIRHQLDTRRHLEEGFDGLFVEDTDPAHSDTLSAGS